MHLTVFNTPQADRKEAFHDIVKNSGFLWNLSLLLLAAR